MFKIKQKNKTKKKRERERMKRERKRNLIKPYGQIWTVAREGDINQTRNQKYTESHNMHHL